MSLAGAGRSPRNHCRKAILADRRKPDSTKQAVRLALHRRKVVIRRQARPEPHKASRQACAHCRRQSSPTGENRTLRSKPPGLRPLAAKRLYGRGVALPPTPRDKTGTNKTQVLRRYGSRDDVPCGCRAEPAKPCRRQSSPAGETQTP